MPIADEWAAGVQPVAISPRSRRFRWGMAGAIVVIVALATTAGAFVLSGAVGSRSLTASMAPRDSVYFMEVRTDLPGDQRANLVDFLSHFPGFKDRAQFDNALDEVLNMLTREVSPDLQYTSAFKPWMEGEVSIAVEDLGGMSSSSSGMCASLPLDQTGLIGLATGLPLASPSASTHSLFRAPSAVAIVALKDRIAAETWVDGELGRLKIATTSEIYDGVRLYTTGAGAGVGAGLGAFALTDNDLLLGTVGGVKAALDTGTNGSLADNPNYQAAMKSLSGDSLARFYVDPSTLVQKELESFGSAMCGIFGAQGTRSVPSFDPKAIPAWLAGAVRAESDTMVVEIAMPGIGTAGLGNHASRIASSLPGNTVGSFEAHSLGRLVNGGLAALTSHAPIPGLDVSFIKNVKDALALIGGLDWLEDGTAVVTKSGSTFDGGIVASVADAATAQSKIGSIGNLLTLARFTTGLQSHDETYQGHKITLVSVPGGAGYPPFQLAISVKDDLIVVGYTDAFVKAVIDTTPATSLASQADYSAVMGAAGSNNEGSVYINVPAVEDQIGLAAVSANPSRWTLDYKPYFDHMGGIAFAVIDGTTVILRLVVTAR